MLKFCYEKKGAISVFLTIILLPVLLLGGLTTDAARIYGAKVVISDAGEMAMNAGLAQYENRLHDEYGLLVMAKDPESMEAELGSYFEKSLNGKGVRERRITGRFWIWSAGSLTPLIWRALRSISRRRSGSRLWNI